MNYESWSVLGAQGAEFRLDSRCCTLGTLTLKIDLVVIIPTLSFDDHASAREMT